MICIAPPVFGLIITPPVLLNVRIFSVGIMSTGTGAPSSLDRGGMPNRSSVDGFIVSAGLSGLGADGSIFINSLISLCLISLTIGSIHIIHGGAIRIIGHPIHTVKPVIILIEVVTTTTTSATQPKEPIIRDDRRGRDRHGQARVQERTCQITSNQSVSLGECGSGASAAPAASAAAVER